MVWHEFFIFIICLQESNMSNAYQLSVLEATSEINPSEVAIYVADINIINGKLIVTTSDGVELDCGTWEGQTGKSIANISLTTESKLLVTYTDNSVYLSAKITDITNYEVKLLGTGLYTGPVEAISVLPGQEYDADNDRVFLVGPDPQFTEFSRNQAIVTPNNITVISSGGYTANNFYFVGKILQRLPVLNTNGHIWASSSPAAQSIIFEFPQDTKVSGYLHRGFRSDYHTSSWIIMGSMDGNSWQDIDTRSNIPFDVLNDFQFASTVTVRFLRFQAVASLRDGGVGRLDFYVIKQNQDVLHKPITFDPAIFTIQDTSEAKLVSYTSLPSGESTSAGTMLASKYARYENTLSKSTSIIPALAAPKRSTLHFKEKFNTAGIISRDPIMVIPKGRWRVRFEIQSGSNASTISLFSLKTRTDIAIGHASASAAKPGSTVIQETDITIINDSEPCVVHLVTTTSIENYNPNDVIFTIEMWKVASEDTVRFALPNNSLTYPFDSSRLLQFELVDGLTSGGRVEAIVDGLIPATAPTNVAFISADHFYTIRVGSPFSVWRAGNTNAISQVPTFKITRLEDNTDWTEYHLDIEPINETQWQQFTLPLPAGTYKFSYNGAQRRENEIIVAAETTVPYLNRTRTIVSLPMTANNTNNQIALASDTQPTYQPWFSFNYDTVLVDNSWIAPAGSLPLWLSLEFTDGPRTINGYYFQNRATPRAPKEFVLQGRMTSADEWVNLHAPIISNRAAAYDYKYVTDIGIHSYSQYRLYITTGHDATYVGIGRLYLVHDTYA
jgi:hypothetical protein